MLLTSSTVVCSSAIEVWLSVSSGSVTKLAMVLEHVVYEKINRKLK